VLARLQTRASQQCYDVDLPAQRAAEHEIVNNDFGGQPIAMARALWQSRLQPRMTSIASERATLCYGRNE
jgi:hypothetical protein